MRNLGWKLFVDTAEKLDNPRDLSDFLHFILTPEEQHAIGDRCRIVQALLEHQETQRDLSKRLQVSIAKITRGSNSLKHLTTQQRQLLMDSLGVSQ